MGRRVGYYVGGGMRRRRVNARLHATEAFLQRSLGGEEKRKGREGEYSWVEGRGDNDKAKDSRDSKETRVQEQLTAGARDQQEGAALLADLWEVVLHASAGISKGSP